MSDARPHVRDLTDGDRPAWGDLLDEYRVSGGLAPEAQVAERLWAWLRSPAHASRGLVAVVDDVVGFAHVRAFERPITATTGLWLDDLYVAPAARGNGAAAALVGAVRELAGREGHDVVRWTTREANTRARRLDDRVAVPAPVVVYDAEPLL